MEIKEFCVNGKFSSGSSYYGRYFTFIVEAHSQDDAINVVTTCMSDVSILSVEENCLED